MSEQRPKTWADPAHDQPLSRHEIAIISLWTVAGLKIAGDDQRPWALRMADRLRWMWVRARDTDDERDPVPSGYTIPDFPREPPVQLGERALLEQAAARAACDVALAMGAASAAITSHDVVVATMPDGSRREVWRPAPPTDKPASGRKAKP